MIRLYHESPEFDEYTRFDTRTGTLVPIPADEFQAALPEGIPASTGQYLNRTDGDGVTAFTGETPGTHTRFPRRLYFQTTRNCNLHCPACFIKAEKGLAHVPTDSIREVASFMGQNGLMEVRLTGGEPTSHPDFFEILHSFQERDVYVSVATNGVFDARTRDALAEERNIWLICSIDGNRETHNKYRGNTYDAILKNLLFLRNRNPSLRLRITTVLTKDNKGQMFELGEMCRSVGAESITIIPLRPQVREPETRNWMVTAAEFKSVLDDLVEARRQLGIRFTTTIETDYKSLIYKDPVFTKRSSCAAGREGTNLDYDAGRDEFLVYGCSYSPASDLDALPEIRKPFLAGTFKRDDPEKFLAIWRDDDRWTLYRDLSLKSDECRQCLYLEKNLCTGSCPIQNIDYDSLRVDGNVLEQLRRQVTSTGEWYCYKRIEGCGWKDFLISRQPT
ncbi:MAG: radical SAM protein [Chloroflexi bacterium]|nr:radical SAM protein [Chloroflexota bacterium]